jgi:glycosyltransferase involved in cell wall biosynthesis
MLEPWERQHKRWKKWPWFHLLERRHLVGAARLLTTSDGEARNLGKLLSSEKCIALPLGLTANRRPDYAAARRAVDWGDSEIVLLFLSRIHPKKGLDLLLRALTQLDPRTLQCVRLVIVGGGEKRYLHELRMFAKREQLRLPKLNWVGEVWGDLKWAYFQGADLFCLTSFSENFGLAILEALQVGTRVLTTNRAPWHGLASWGAGFVVEPTELAVRSALAGFLVRPEWPIAHRAKLASEIHTRFSWDAVGPSYVRFYEEVYELCHQ